ncbi:MAG: hypothetical protein IKU42_01025 [Oscillospiraceae bacterium]|nr:hypothetical protein [Oscillospiraceae bacterium]
MKIQISDMVTKFRGTEQERFLLNAERLYQKVLATRGEIQGAGVEQNSIKKTQTMDWETQIRGALEKNGDVVRSDTLVVGTIPYYLKLDGIKDVPLAIPLRIISKAQSGKDVYHSINDTNLINLQSDIKNAKIVIDDVDRNSLVFITENEMVCLY